MQSASKSCASLMKSMAALFRSLVHYISRVIDGDTKPILTPRIRSASQKCEYLMSIYQRKRGTLLGLFSFLLVIEVIYLAMSWDYAMYMMSPNVNYPREKGKLAFIVNFFGRAALIVLTSFFLALVRSQPVSKEEQKFLHSVLFDHHLERDIVVSQCKAVQECFSTHAQHCESEFTAKQMIFMRIMCLSSVLHGTESTISSARTRGLMQILFVRLWPLSSQEKEVALYVKCVVSHLCLRARLAVYMQLAVNTSIMELAAWLGFLLYLHAMLSNGAVTNTWIGAYDEMLRFSNYSFWDNSRGQDPRYLNDLIYVMSDSLLACLAFCSLFPISVSASMILLLPVVLLIQISFEMQPDAIRNNQLSPTAGIGQSQLYIIVSFYVLIRHNLQTLRNYRNDYLSSFRQRLDFLPQGVDNAPSNPSQDRMIILAQKVLLQMTQMAVPKDQTVTGQPVESLPNHPSSAALSAVVSAAASPPSSKFAAACSAINTLVCFLQSSGTAGSSSTVCNLSKICQAAISQCKPLLKKRIVSLNYLGHRPFVPLRVLVVDDSALVRRFLERLLRNRGYYYHSCPDGECSVKAFQNSLQGQPHLYSRFDLILMDKDMPTSCPDGHQSAGMSAVKMIRELSRLQTEVEPGFRCPCIIGNSACTDEDDSTWIMFRNELELSRQQAGIPCNLLILKEKMSTWSDSFDVEVRQLCGLGETLDSAEMGDEPTIWGNPIRLEMMFRNLITNAIQYGKPSVGEHYVNLSYDIIDRQSLVHPCLMLSDQDDEVARSLTWQLSFDFKERTQRYVQVMVTDNGPGIDIERMRTRPQSSSDFNDVAETNVGGVRVSAIGSVSNFGVCLQRIVCPEVARCHGAMGVHSRIEPSSGCSFVVALPYCSPAVRSYTE